MANPKDAKNSQKKGQDNKKKDSKKSIALHNLYNVSGDKIDIKNRFCPKCGPGYFMGKHSDRVVCGKCKYVEYVRK